MARRLLLPLLLALGVSAADSNTPKAAASTETTPATGSAVVDPPAAAPVAAVSQIVKAVKTALAGSSLASVDPALALSDDGSIAEAMNITDVLPSSDINSPECLQQRIADTCLSTLAARAGSAGLQDAVVECLRFRVLQRTTDPAGDESIECEAKPQNSELEDLTQMQDPSTAAASAGNNEQNARLLAQRLMTLGVDAAKAAKLAAETVPVVDAGNKDGSASLQSSLQGSMSRVQSLSAATADADIKRLDDEDSSALTSDGERFKTSVDRTE
nr:hypothetical protein HK105_008163 [Polyrhizophydium stewartii]